MKQDEIAQRVQRIISKELRRPLSDVVPSASFVRDLQADSLEIVELVFAIEHEFGIKIPDDEAEKLSTVQEAISYICSVMSD
jgi:acyl carrier protein